VSEANQQTFIAIAMNSIQDSQALPALRAGWPLQMSGLVLQIFGGHETGVMNLGGERRRFFQALSL